MWQLIQNLKSSLLASQKPVLQLQQRATRTFSNNPVTLSCPLDYKLLGDRANIFHSFISISKMVLKVGLMHQSQGEC